MTTSEATAPTRGSFLLRAILAVVALGLLLFVGRKLGGYVPAFATWVESLGVWGPIAFMLGYVVAAVAFIPGSILTLAAGAIFGLARGTLYVFIGATTGATLAFLIARYVARGAIERRIEGNTKFAAIDNAVAGQGLKITTLLRLSPVFPFNLLNYGLGLTRVRLRDYVLASFGMLPGTFLYVYYGKALGSLAAVAGGAQVEKGPKDWAFLAVGLAATIAVTIVVTRTAKKALAEKISDSEQTDSAS